MFTDKIVIAVAGKKKTGKDTLGKMLAGELNVRAYIHENVINDVEIFHFADPIKKFCHEYLGLDNSKMYGSDEDKNELTDIFWTQMPFLPKNFQPPSYQMKMTYRQIMQYVGTEWFRRINDHIWIDKCFEAISGSKCRIALICDCRFPNEVLSVKKLGGYAMKIERNLDSGDSHASETSLDPGKFDRSNFNLIVDNNNDTILPAYEKFSSFVRGLIQAKHAEKTVS
jgi:hypothetical protein